VRTNLSKNSAGKWTVECDYHDGEDPVTHEFASREAAEDWQRNPVHSPEPSKPEAKPKKGKPKGVSKGGG